MEYKNSLGYRYAEECVKCPHRDLCFKYLEYTGDITKSAQPIFWQCAKIKADPEGMTARLNKLLEAWRKQMAQNCANSAHAEGWEEIK
jgi:hypothetical protein